MIDNTYLEITFMFYLIFGLILIEPEFEGEEIKWLLHFKNMKN